MKTTLHRVVTALSAVLFVSSLEVAHAAEIGPMFKVGYDTGGETLVTVTFTNGERSSIKANQGFYFGGGVSILNDAKTVETEVSLSWKFQSITASNGDVTWTRFPLDALVFYRLPRVRVGAGLTYHMSPKLDGSGVAGGLNTEVKDAAGGVLQADWRITEAMNLGLRYTALEYKDKTTSTAAKSNGVGVVFGSRF